MALKRNTSQREIDQHLQNEIAKAEEKLVKALHRVGMECLTEARNQGEYIDQTGNLRSSIGYVILKDGMLIDTSDFAKVKDGGEGQRIGKIRLTELSQKFPNGYVLIMVAGMNYAAYVEAKGRNVLSSSELLAKKTISVLLQKLGFSKR